MKLKILQKTSKKGNQYYVLEITKTITTNSNETKVLATNVFLDNLTLARLLSMGFTIQNEKL